MLKDNTNLVFRLLNIWLAFVALLFISSYLPHWENMSLHAWLNEAFYFLLFLLAVTICTKESANKDIFFNLSLSLLADSLSFLNVFIGDGYLFGNNYTAYYILIYRRMVLFFFFNFAILYIVLKYLFSHLKMWRVYLLTLAVLLPAFLAQFYPYIQNAHFIFTLGDRLFPDLYRRALLIHALSFFFVLLYGYLLLKKDRLLGEYINALMAFFFVFLVIEMIEMLSKIYSFQVFSITQYIITINLFFLCIILFKKLYFLCSEYGRFYETLIRTKTTRGKIPIQRRRSETNALLIQILKLYIYQRRNYLLTLSLFTSVGFIYFQFPKFFTINVTALLCCSMVLFLFINALYKRRSKQKFTLP